MSATTNSPARFQALVLGIAGGMRSQLPLALLANATAPPSDTGSLLRTPLAQRLTLLAAGTELVVDKLPGVGSRLAPGPLTARLLIGGVAGGILADRARQPRLAGVALGAAGAALGAWTGYHLRATLVAETPMPDFVFAVTEDLTALTLGALATRTVSS